MKNTGVAILVIVALPISDAVGSAWDGMRKQLARGEFYPFRPTTAQASQRECMKQTDFQLEKPAFGDVLPQMGRDLYYIDMKSGERMSAANRTVEQRLRDYSHPCILRNPVKSVSSEQLAKWKNNRYATRQLNLRGSTQRHYAQRLHYYEDLIALVAAECYEPFALYQNHQPVLFGKLCHEMGRSLKMEKIPEVV